MQKPRCPHCNALGLNQLAAQKAGAFMVIFCGQCGAIHGIIPQPATDAWSAAPAPAQKQSAPITPQPKADQPLQPVAQYLVELGHADLTQKQPYSPEKMAARLRAAGQGRATPYLRVAIDHGPPVCVTCKTEMSLVVIPAGFPNSGLKVWVCDNYDQCRRWELAE